MGGRTKLTYDFIKGEIEKHGYVLISKEYVNNSTKLDLKCPNEHNYSANWSNFSLGKRCPFCRRTKIYDVEDIVGQKYFRLTVVKYDGHYSTDANSQKIHYYICDCDCGNKKTVNRHDLSSGFVKSCGCWKEEFLRAGRVTHGLSGSKLYRTHSGMITRCHNKNEDAYKDYGGRGISICDEWLGESGFINFYNWAISNGYKDGLTIDRIDVNGNYEPSNCKWSTIQEQNNNRRTNKKFKAISPSGEIFYSNSMTLFAEQHNIARHNISNCLRKKCKSRTGWHFEWI